MRWWNEFPNAELEILQANYTVPEFVEAIPVIQRVVDDKRAGVVVPIKTMSRADRIANLPRASVPILLTDQHGGTTKAKFSEPACRSADALIGEYANALRLDAAREQRQFGPSASQQRAEQRSGTTSSSTSASSSIPSSAARKGSSRVQLDSREDVQRWSDARSEYATSSASSSISSTATREGSSYQGAATIIKTLDPNIFIDYCEVCADYEDARIRWIDTTKDGENSHTRVVGQPCRNNRRGCSTLQITEDERFVGCCFRCASNLLCSQCAWERTYDRGVVPPMWKRSQLDDGVVWQPTRSHEPCWFYQQGPGRCYDGRFCGYAHEHSPGNRRARRASYYSSMD